MARLQWRKAVWFVFTLIKPFPVCLIVFSLGINALGEDAYGPIGISLEESRNLALLHNLEIQAARLGSDAAGLLYRAEIAKLWEPAFVTSFDRELKQQQSARERAVFFTPQDRYLLNEQRNMWESSVVQPLPTGGSLRLGYRMVDLKTNRRQELGIGGPSRQYEGLLGIHLEQPLLKGAGTRVALAMMRLARTESDAAFQQLRRQLMQTLAGVEAAYWNLYLTQQRLAYRRDSVRVAEQILHDNRVRVETGRMAETEVWQAEAGLAFRQAQMLDAHQRWIEASSQLRTFFSESMEQKSPHLIAGDAPPLLLLDLDAQTLLDQALRLHPDYLASLLAVQRERIRLDVARNMRMPQLDLRGSYGYTGFGETANEAWKSMENLDHTAWSVGLVARIPLGGGQSERRELQAARLRHDQQQRNRDAVRVEMQNMLVNSIQRVHNSYDQACSYANAVEINEALLRTELARLDTGQSDSRKVLDIEDLLTQARDSHAAALTRHVVAVIENELVSGTLLANRSIDPSP